MSFIVLKKLTPLHEAYAACIGRGLVVCQHIESCAHHVMVVYAVTDAMAEGVDESERLREIALDLRGASLGQSIKRLSASGDFAARAEAVETGRRARNWLVHEAADVIEAGYSVPGVLERFREFVQEVTTLCEADRILSIASYEICERRPAPSTFVADYSRDLKQWILDPIFEGVGALLNDVESDEVG